MPTSITTNWRLKISAAPDVVQAGVVTGNAHCMPSETDLPVFVARPRGS